MTTNKKALLLEYDREMIKSSLMSLFWAIISDRKKRHKYTMQAVADAMGRDKSQVSRWFSSPPNWRLETVADMASALDVDLEIRARDRATGVLYTPSGPAPAVGIAGPYTSTRASDLSLPRDGATLHDQQVTVSVA